MTSLCASVPQRFIELDLWVMLAAVLLAFAASRRPIGRVTGAVFLLGYTVYMILLYHFGSD